MGTKFRFTSGPRKKNGMNLVHNEIGPALQHPAITQIISRTRGVYHIQTRPNGPNLIVSAAIFVYLGLVSQGPGQCDSLGLAHGKLISRFGG